MLYRVLGNLAYLFDGYYFAVRSYELALFPDSLFNENKPVFNGCNPVVFDFA